MARPSSDGPRELALLRWQLLRALRGFQIFKHGEIFGPISRGDDARLACLASEMKDRCALLGEAYTKHVQRWSLTGIEVDRTAYELEATGMIARIEQHLATEAIQVTRLLSGRLT